MSDDNTFEGWNMIILESWFEKLKRKIRCLKWWLRK